MMMATTKGLEPSTSGVTGRRSNQLNYVAVYPGSTYGYPGQPTGPWAQVSLIGRGAGSWNRTNDTRIFCPLLSYL